MEHMHTDIGVLQAKVDSHEKQIDEIKRSHSHDIDELKTDVTDIKNRLDGMHELNTNIKLLAEGVATIKDDIIVIKDSVSETSNKVHELETQDLVKKGKFVENAKSAVIIAILTTIATLILTAIINLL